MCYSFSSESNVYDPEWVDLKIEAAKIESSLFMPLTGLDCSWKISYQKVLQHCYSRVVLDRYDSRNVSLQEHSHGTSTMVPKKCCFLVKKTCITDKERNISLKFCSDFPGLNSRAFHT